MAEKGIEPSSYCGQTLGFSPTGTRTLLAINPLTISNISFVQPWLDSVI